jgi:hypothetical protein
MSTIHAYLERISLKPVHFSSSSSSSSVLDFLIVIVAAGAFRDGGRIGRYGRNGINGDGSSSFLFVWRL